VPVFVQHARDERQFWRLVSVVFSLAGLAFVSLAAALALFAEPVVAIIGTGLSSDNERLLAVNLMRIALVSVIFQGLAGVLTAALYAHNRFALPAFATAIYNVGIIVGVLVTPADVQDNQAFLDLLERARFRFHLHVKRVQALARAGRDASTGFLVMTSRASYELVQKAAVAGVPLLAAVSRPTGLAVRLADAAGVTLVALLRGQSANVYTHPERIGAG